MDELLTTTHVQELLKIDRITVYRMLNDGRLKGVKVGNHWRFTKNEIARLLGDASADAMSERAQIDLSDFPSQCAGQLQGIFAGILKVGVISVNLNGEILTEPVFSNPFCKMMLSNPDSRKACQDSWRRIATKTTGNPEFHICHAGLCYLRSPITLCQKQVAWMVTGQFFISSPSTEKTAKKMTELSQLYGFAQSELENTVKDVPILKHNQQIQVQEWAPKVADTIQSMLYERLDLVNRLEKIAELSQVRSSLKKDNSVTEVKNGVSI